MTTASEKRLQYLRADYDDAEDRVRDLMGQATEKLEGAFMPGRGGRQGWLWVYLRRVAALRAVWRLWTAAHEAECRRAIFHDAAQQWPWTPLDGGRR